MDPWAANDEWKLGDCALFLQAMVGCCSPWPLPSLVDAGVWVEGCVSVGRSFLLDHYDLYFNAYYCFRVIFIHLAPCCALVVLNALLGRTSCYSTASQRTHRARPLANKVKDFDCGQLWAYPPESAPSRGESRPPSSLGRLPDSTDSIPKRYLDQLIRFCKGRVRDRQTDGPHYISNNRL